MIFTIQPPNISGLSDIEAAFALIVYAFENCVKWFDSVVANVGAYPIIMAVVGLILIVGLFILPLRGSIPFGSPMADASVNHIKYKNSSMRASGSRNKYKRMDSDAKGG